MIAGCSLLSGAPARVECDCVAFPGYLSFGTIKVRAAKSKAIKTQKKASDAMYVTTSNYTGTFGPTKDGGCRPEARGPAAKASVAARLMEVIDTESEASVRGSEHERTDRGTDTL